MSNLKNMSSTLYFEGVKVTLIFNAQQQPLSLSIERNEEEAIILTSMSSSDSLERIFDSLKECDVKWHDVPEDF